MTKPKDSSVKKQLVKVGHKMMRQVGNQLYEVSYKDGNVCQLPSTKEERRKMLRHIVMTKLQDRWRNISSKVATLERQVISELIDSI
jgi:hypothetical protein